MEITARHGVGSDIQVQLVGQVGSPGLKTENRSAGSERLIQHQVNQIIGRQILYIIDISAGFKMMLQGQRALPVAYKGVQIGNPNRDKADLPAQYFLRIMIIRLFLRAPRMTDQTRDPCAPV